MSEDEGKSNTKRPKSIFQVFYDTLSQQFKTVEATYEARRATFEVRTDAGLESGALSAGEELVCNVSVHFEEKDSPKAKVTVECTDAKLASNVQECLHRIADASAPVRI